jgi:hypothetical protein
MELLGTIITFAPSRSSVHVYIVNIRHAAYSYLEVYLKILRLVRSSGITTGRYTPLPSTLVSGVRNRGIGEGAVVGLCGVASFIDTYLQLYNNMKLL